MKNTVVGFITLIIMGILVVVFWRVVLFLLLGFILLLVILGFITRNRLKGFINSAQYEEPSNDNQESLGTDVIDAEFSVKDSGETHD